MQAVQRTAVLAVRPIKKRVPVAFGELRDSVAPMDIGSAPKTCVDAPHAAAVEQGSMPHTPDFERLLAWVRLRGLQGLTPRGRLRNRFPKHWGFTTPSQARSVATMFKAFEVRGKRGVGRHSPINAPEAIARAISAKIEKTGTKPFWYVRDSLPEIMEILGLQLKTKLDTAFKRAARPGRFRP